MSRKRAMFPIVYASECEESKGNINCIKEFEEKHHVAYIPLSKSKLLIALLNDVSDSISFFYCIFYCIF